MRNCKDFLQHIFLFLLLFFNVLFCFSQKKVDTFSSKNFDDLFEKYHTNTKFKEQYYSLKKLLNLDSIPQKDLNHLLESISREYDIVKLTSEKEKMADQIKNKEDESKKIAFYASTVFVLLIVGFAFQYRKRKGYKRSFEELMGSQNSITISSNNPTRIVKGGINIPDDIVEEILKNLEVFEKKHQFTYNHLTLNILAKKLNTNANYLSKIINHYKKQSFTHYLTNLRVHYAVKRLKDDTIFRKYTVKAISEEVGFKTSESFAKAFYKKTGIRPSYFIKELEKSV